MTELGIWLFGFIGGVCFQIYANGNMFSPASKAVWIAATLGAVALVAPDAVS